MKKLYIISGPNGAGKTTASFTILPEILDCLEFVNADEIARGISPLNPEGVAIQAGRLMLDRINELLDRGITFAFETTLSTRSYKNFVIKAQSKGYEVILLFLYLDSVELAINRVKRRVEEGGHDIPLGIIERRFEKGLKNLFQIFIPLVDKWMLVDNSKGKFQFIAEGAFEETIIRNQETWKTLMKKYHGN